jgi:hypothetical protein
MNNELILEKLIQLGFVKIWHSGLVHEITGLFDAREFDADSARFSPIIFDALVSECGKRGLFMKIINNNLEIYDCELTFEEEEENIQTIYYDIYTRQNIAQAFMKVTGLRYENT